jgi:hypothetical protein
MVCKTKNRKRKYKNKKNNNLNINSKKKKQGKKIMYDECCVCYMRTKKNDTMCHTTCKKCLNTMLEMFQLSCPLCRKKYTNKTISLSQNEINKVLEKHAIKLKESIFIDNTMIHFGEYILYMKGIIKENSKIRDYDIYEINENEYYICYNYKFYTNDGKKGFHIKDIKEDVTSYEYALKININENIKKIYKKIDTKYKPKYKFDFSNHPFFG